MYITHVEQQKSKAKLEWTWTWHSFNNLKNHICSLPNMIPKQFFDDILEAALDLCLCSCYDHRMKIFSEKMTAGLGCMVIYWQVAISGILGRWVLSLSFSNQHFHSTSIAKCYDICTAKCSRNSEFFPCIFRFFPPKNTHSKEFLMGYPNTFQHIQIFFNCWGTLSSHINLCFHGCLDW